MQDKSYSYYLCYQEDSSLHHPEKSAPTHPADSIDITSTSTYINVPVNLHEWSSSVAPIMEHSDRSLTALPGVAENFGRVAHTSCHQTALGRAPPSPLASCDYSADAHLRPWWSAVEVETARACAPQTAGNEGRVTLMQFGRSQVPSGTTDLNAFGASWSQGGDTYHAVAAPAQPAFLHNVGRSLHPVPAWSSMAAPPEVSSTSQTHMTGVSTVSCRMTDAVLGHVPPSANHRQYHRRPHARLEHVICDTCKKPMRRQSLRRHIREVHDHIKRGHAKSGFAAGPLYQ